MPNLGVSELLVIFMILLVVFGASRLPALGEGLGRAMRGLKRGMSHDDNIQVDSDASSADGAGAEGDATASKPAAKPAAKLAAKSAAKPAERDAEDAELVDPKA